jgi:F-type H+-transporting ATPase subunit alpha
VGGNAQIKAMKQVAGRLRLDLAQYRELAAFAKFGSDLDKATLAQITRGQRMVEILKQGQYRPLPVAQQVTIIFLGVNGYMDSVPVEQIERCESEFHRFVESNYNDILKEITSKKELTDEVRDKLKSICEEFMKTFVVEE